MLRKITTWTALSRESDGITVNSTNNGHFGARPTVRYSCGVLYWGIIVVTTFNVFCSKFLANMGRANISQGYKSTSSL